MEHNGSSTEEIREAVAAELRAARARVRMTRPQLVALSGVSQAALERLENAERDMSMPQLIALTTALKADPTKFMQMVFEHLHPEK